MASPPVRRGHMRLTGVPVRAGRSEGTAQVEERAPPASVPDAAIGSGPSVREGLILCADSFPPERPGLRESAWAGYVISSRQPTGLAPEGPPVVGGLEPLLFRTGEPVSLDGGTGEVVVGGVREVRVVTSFLERPDGKILLLRRSDQVGSFQGRWAGVSGFLEDATPLEQAVREIREETGVPPDLARLAAHGPTVYAREGDRIFAIHPFRFRVGEVTISLDWEHTEFAWVDPQEVRERETVPRLDRVWEAVSPRRAATGLPNP